MSILSRYLAIRILYEWRRFGGLRPLLGRILAIHRTEGWQGLLLRMNNLLGRLPGLGKSCPADRAPQGIPTPAPGSQYLQLIGHPYGILGVGENLRAIAVALDAGNIPFNILDAFGADRDDSLLQDFRYKDRLTTARQPAPINIFCLNANEMDMVLSHQGPDLFKNATNIACWMWELAEFPKQWCGNFRYVQEIWAQSRFVQESISKKSPVPVIWMPQVVEPGLADPEIAKALGVPDDCFTFLFFFDFTSFIARKNPMAVIEAFRLAFDSNDHLRVALVVKMNGIDKCPADYQRFISEFENSDQRVIFIDKVLSSREIKGLIAGCDVFVSLHRSEGFGRGIAEAMYYGKPTIVTAYSGNMDFTNPLNSCLVDYTLVPVRKGEYPFWERQVWAKPDIHHAAAWMRRLYEDKALYEALGKRASESIRASNGADVVGRRMSRRIRELRLP